GIFRMQIDVERHQIEKRELEVFGGRVIHICEKGSWIFGLSGPIELAKELLDFGCAVPSDNRSGNFVSNGVAQDRRMSSARSNLRTHAVDNVICKLCIVEKCHVLF